jgi:ABC-type transport system substrate-binding protein
VGRLSAAIIVIVIIVVAGIAAYFVTVRPSTTTSTSTTPTSAALPTQLTIDEPSPIVSADPGVSIDLAGEEIICNTNLPLIFFNTAGPQYNGYMPVLANSWQETSGGETYTFNLRPNIYFSNGHPFNAYVVWYNFYRNIFMLQALDYVYLVYANTTGVTVGDVNSLNNPQNQPNATLLSIMQNPHNSATVLNATAIQFHLTAAYAGFLAQVASGPPWDWVDPYVVQQHGGVVANQPNSYMAENGTTVGLGPYIMQKYVPNQYATLIANPHYWAANLTASEKNFMLESPLIPEITVNYKSVELTRSLDLRNNRVQAAPILYSDVASVLTSDPNLYIPHIGLSSTLEWLALNTFKFPFNNTLVRRAVIESINVTQIQQVVYRGYIAPLNGPVLQGFFGYNSSISPIPYNVADAKTLLTEAGYPNGQGLPKISFIYYKSEEADELASVLVNDLSQIGITLVPEGLSTSAAISIFGLPPTDPKAPLIEQETWTYYPDFTAYEFVIDADLGVFSTFNNATINNLIYASNAELNLPMRAQELSRIVQLTNEQAAFVWMGQDVDTYATGVGNGPIVWNSCLTGMFENAGFIGVDFAPVHYTCSPTG